MIIKARQFLRAPLAAAAITVILSVLVLLPDRFKLDRWTPFAQIVAFRPALATATVIVGVLMLPLRWTRPCATVLLALGVLAASMVLPRAIPSAEPAAGGRELSVLEFNVYAGQADVAALAQVIRARHPDLVALPEAGQLFRMRLDHQLRGLGYRSWSSRGPGEHDIKSVTALAAPSAGTMRAERGTQTFFPYLKLTGGALGQWQFVALHTLAPVPGDTGPWRRELGILQRWCLSGNAIVAADLNATFDQSVLRDNTRGCVDAADRRGKGLVGTWPSAWPRWLAVPIDHILATNGTEVRDFTVLDIPGSDHRAIFARLRLPD